MLNTKPQGVFDLRFAISDLRIQTIQSAGILHIVCCSLCLALCFFIDALYADDMADVQIIGTLNDGLVIAFQMPEIKANSKEAGGQTYQALSFKNCSFTHEVGKAQVPIRIITLGIPDASRPDVSVLSSESSLLTGYKLYPVIEETNSAIDRTFYAQSAFYPSDIAQIKPIGYLREHRLARLELHPVQYNPATGQTRIYKKLKVKVTFSTPGVGYSTPDTNSHFTSKVRQSVNAFEDLYKDTLLNYDQARGWKKSRGVPSRDVTFDAAVEEGKLFRSLAPSRELEIKYKLVINENGIYRLDYYYLKSVGIDPTTIDPRRIELQSYGEQIPIYVEGYQDGKFDPGDYIEFYGVKMDSIYTNDNIYWLSWDSSGSSGAKSWMMAVKDGTPKTPDLTPPGAFLYTEHLERDQLYDPLKMVKSETADHFFWSAMRGQDPRYGQTAAFTINLPYRVPNINNQFNLRVCFQGVTFARGASNHNVNINFNSPVGIASWEGANEYVKEIPLTQRLLRIQNWFSLSCDDNNGTTAETDPKWDVYLNWIEVDYWRNFTAEKDFLEFSTDTLPTTAKTAQFSVRNFSSPDIAVFQIEGSSAIAKVINPKVEEEDENSYKVTFEDDVVQPTRYFVTAIKAMKLPFNIFRDEPSTLHDPANRVDYIMITHKDFRKSTERLAEFRRKQGLDVIVVDIEDIYDEFSYGVFDPRAIKRFLQYAFFNWDKIPVYVLLMGDAHWDYKYVFNENYLTYDRYPRIYIPTYHAWREPYGETAMDHRFVTVSGDDILPDMFIGRIPAESAEEADIAVDKIIAYEDKPYRGLWQTRIMLIADDEKSKSGDEVFEDSRIELANNYVPIGYELAEIYLRRIGEPYIARKMINMEINNTDRGVVMLEYSGHGGAHTWAHELIFSWEDVIKLRNNDRYPFVITTTCENGYFDNPTGGKKSIMELFLFQPNAGAVACFSATRLTYGQGNATFDKIMYPKIFSETPPIIGKIINEAKIDFINLDIATWTPAAEQYTLFGDPATRLALPEREIDCNLAMSSVDQSKPIELKPGTVKRIRPDPLTGEKGLVTDTGFNAQMIVSVVYPNNMDDNPFNDLPVQTEFVKITKGEFGKASLKIPDNILSGEGRLRCFASSGESSAIGGIRFKVFEPVVEVALHRSINDESLQVYAAVVDNLGQAGIKSVECEWHDTETWKWYSYTMIPSEPPPDPPEVEGLWYVLKNNIPFSRPGTSIEYRIRVLDTEEKDITSQLQRFKVPIGVNLAVSWSDNSTRSSISYSYSQSDRAWILSADVENNGGKEVKTPIAVYFFEGNPDRNKDEIVDKDAALLGSNVINYEQWKPAEKVIQTAKVYIKLKEPLASGYHQIFAWVNPNIKIYEEEPEVQRVEDADFSDDMSSRLFQINEFLVGKGNESADVRSLDNSLNMLITSGSVDETVMSITRLEPPKPRWEQPDLHPAPVPESEYGVDSNAFKIQLASGNKYLRKEAQIEIKFDAMKLREMVKEARGLAGKADNELSRNELDRVELTWQKEAKKLGIYAWQEDIGMWRYIPSILIMDEGADENAKKFALKPYVSIPSSENSTGAQLDFNSIVVDEILTPLGSWAIFFVDPDTYKIYLRKQGLKTYEDLRYGEVGRTYSKPELGLQITINKPSEDFRFGDIFKFDTYQDPTGVVKVQGLRNYCNGDGTAQVELLSPEDFYDVSFSPGGWAIFFIDSKTFEIHSQLGNVVTDAFGSPFTGEVGSEILLPNVGIRIEVYEGRWPYQFGDKFVFKTISVGAVQAKTNLISTVALMQSDDLVPPKIQLWVNKQNPQIGAVIPPFPSISIMLSDTNGIDLDSISFLMSINDREFNPVPKDDYVFSVRGGGVNSLANVPIFYSPTLRIGKYRYRISVSDFNGNISKGSNNNDYLEYMFLVEEQPDLKPPTITVNANDQALINGQVFDKSPELKIDIEDDNALDIRSIILMMAYENEPLTPLKKNEYKMTISDDFKNASLIYSPYLMNGEYSIQVKSSDTSGNTAYLTPEDAEPTRFRVNEKVEVKDILNYPNPFSEKTVFSYYLTQPADKIIIKIYTLRGKLVKTLEQNVSKWKYNEEFWDGRDEEGTKLASGAYFYKFIVIDKDRKIERVGKLAIIR